MATETAVVGVKKAKAPRDPNAAPRSYSVRLVGGPGELLWFRAYKVRDGWRTEVVHRAGKKNARGATQTHASLADAKATVDRLANAAAKKLGWRRKESRGGGFARKPDAFGVNALPAPTKPKK